MRPRGFKMALAISGEYAGLVKLEWFSIAKGKFRLICKIFVSRKMASEIQMLTLIAEDKISTVFFRPLKGGSVDF